MIKNDEFPGILKTFKSKFVVLKKFQCILFLNFQFDGGLFFNFYFDITMKYFLNAHFHFIWVTKVVSSFQMSIMVLIFSNDSNNTKFLIFFFSIEA
jgi:hypothetical protein